MSTTLDSFAIEIGQTGAGAAAGDVDKLASSMDGAEESSMAFDVAVGQLAANLAGKLVDAAMAAGKWLLELVPSFAGAGDEIAKTSKALQVNSDELQRMRYAGERSGVSTATLDASLGKLTKGLEDARVKGTGPLVEGLASLGLELEDLEGLSTEEKVGLIGEAMGEIDDESRRSAIGMQIFGDRSGRMNVLAMEGAEGIKALGDRAEDLGRVLDEETIAAGEELTDQLLDLDAMIGGLVNKLAAGLMPAFSAAVDGVMGFIEANGELIDQGIDLVLTTLIDVAEALEPAIAAVADVLGVLLPLVGDIVTAVMPAVLALGELLGTILQKLTPAIEKLAEALGPLIEFLGERLVVAVEELEGPILMLVDTVVVLVDGLVWLIDIVTTVYSWLNKVAGALEEKWPKAFGVAKAVVHALTHPLETARDTIAAFFAWLEKAVSKIEVLAKLVRQIRTSLGLLDERGTGGGIGAIGRRGFGQPPPAGAEAEGDGPSEAAGARAAKREANEKARAQKKQGKGGGKGKSKPATDEDVLGPKTLSDVLGGGKAPGASLVRIDASFNAPTTINLAVYGVDLGDPNAIESIRNEIAGELGADLAERDRQAFDRYKKVLV